MQCFRDRDGFALKRGTARAAGGISYQLTILVANALNQSGFMFEFLDGFETKDTVGGSSWISCNLGLHL